MSLFSHILLKGFVAFFWGRVLWRPVVMYCVLCVSAAPALSTWDTWKCSEENWRGISHTLPGWGCQRCCTRWKDVGLWLVWWRYLICVIFLWQLKIYFDHVSGVFVFDGVVWPLCGLIYLQRLDYLTTDAVLLIIICPCFLHIYFLIYGLGVTELQPSLPKLAVVPVWEPPYRRVKKDGCNSLQDWIPDFEEVSVTFALICILSICVFYGMYLNI